MPTGVTAMPFLQFAFTNIWHFLGTIILLILLFEGVALVIHGHK